MIESICGTHDRGGSLPSPFTGLPESKGREVVHMTAYETVMVILGISGLLISFGSFLLALLAFLKKRK